MPKSNQQIKSRRRVADHGEVFTNEREVKAMLNLVRKETERIESRFLEPACGTGNFLHAVLERKLTVIDERYKKSQTDFEKNALLAVGSIYGIDVLMDNVLECRKRLLQLLLEFYARRFLTSERPAFQRSVEFVLSRNIIHGDALTLMNPEGTRPIVFSEWTILRNSIKRRDYTMIDLLASQPLDGPNLFSDLGDQAFIPTPVGEFPVTNYLELGADDKD